MFAHWRYRRAPEFPYPIPFNDCLYVVQHVLMYPEQYGADRKNIFLGGKFPDQDVYINAYCKWWSLLHTQGISIGIYIFVLYFDTRIGCRMHLIASARLLVIAVGRSYYLDYAKKLVGLCMCVFYLNLFCNHDHNWHDHMRSVWCSPYRLCIILQAHASRKSPNEAPWETLSERLSRLVSANL